MTMKIKWKQIKAIGLKLIDWLIDWLSTEQGLTSPPTQYNFRNIFTPPKTTIWTTIWWNRMTIGPFLLTLYDNVTDRQTDRLNDNY